MMVRKLTLQDKVSGRSSILGRVLFPVKFNEALEATGPLRDWQC